jgi:HPt (histidine-containing phosphotransfer) domain-containing protein
VAPNAADAAAALARLRERFVAGLPARWAEIRDAADPAGRSAALHRLAGAAGAYGFDALGAAARAAERALGAGDAAGAERALAQLRRLLADAGVTVR